MSNVSPTVRAEPLQLTVEFQRLLIGQVTRGIVLPLTEEKNLRFCSSLSILNRSG